jgi:hypothetical protein
VEIGREILERAGVPLGAVRLPPRSLPDDASLREALMRASLDPAAFPPEALLAWLRAFQHHFAPAFERVLGDTGRELIARLDGPRIDRNRYVKLRRIAIENLAHAV